MKTYKDFDFPLNEILKKQLDLVNAPKDFDLSKDYWYDQYIVNEIQENNFKDWLRDYAYKHWKDLKKADMVLKSHPTKKAIQKFVDHWLLFYFWKTKRRNK